jgi:hypothetical protein
LLDGGEHTDLNSQKGPLEVEERPSSKNAQVAPVVTL